MDTLLAAALFAPPPALTILVVEMFSITVVSTIILATIYRRHERAMVHVVACVTASNRSSDA